MKAREKFSIKMVNHLKEISNKTKSFMAFKNILMEMSMKAIFKATKSQEKDNIGIILVIFFKVISKRGRKMDQEKCSLRMETATKECGKVD